MGISWDDGERTDANWGKWPEFEIFLVIRRFPSNSMKKKCPYSSSLMIVLLIHEQKVVLFFVLCLYLVMTI